MDTTIRMDKKEERNKLASLRKKQKNTCKKNDTNIPKTDVSVKLSSALFKPVKVTSYISFLRPYLSINNAKSYTRHILFHCSSRSLVHLMSL